MSEIDQSMQFFFDDLGPGNTIETRLFNRNQDEEAIYSQMIAFEGGDDI